MPGPIDGAAVMRWANESFKIARSPNVKYCVQDGNVCNRPQGDVVVGTKNDTYLKDNTETVRQRLKMAGVRLGAVLKQILTNEAIAEITRHRPWRHALGGGHETLDATLWVQTAAEYRMSTAEVFALAAIRLEQAIKDEKWTAIPAQESQPNYQYLPKAVIFDLDETLLDNSAFQGELIAGKSTAAADALWERWVALERAAPVRGALEFVREVRKDCVAGEVRRDCVEVFYVTNRSHGDWQSTVRNLRQLGFPVSEDGKELLSAGKMKEWDHDKETRRQYVAEHHRVLLLVGDDLNDFVTGVRGAGITPERRREVAERHAKYWGRQWIVVPNPMYGSWEPALYSGEKLERAEKLRRKGEWLNRF